MDFSIDDDPFEFSVTVCLPLGEGGEITLDIEIEHPEKDTMVMLVTTVSIISFITVSHFERHYVGTGCEHRIEVQAQPDQ